MKRPHGSGHLYVKWGAYYVRWRTPDGRHSIGGSAKFVGEAKATA